MDYSYFAARSDAAAAAVVTWPRGPHFPPTDADAAGLLSELVQGVQFSQELGRYAQLVLGTEGDLEGGEHHIAGGPVDRKVVRRVPPVLVRAVAGAGIDRLHSLVPAWAEFPDFADPDPDRLRAFATDLHRLCRTATEASGGVYSYGYA